eukprot:m51a1_g9650 hypothetical protein (582) ;mRNA; f:1183037-1185220
MLPLYHVLVGLIVAGELLAASSGSPSPGVGSQQRCCHHGHSARRAPNIVFMLADDLGWNDVSFHGSAQIPTPSIDSLAASGVRLDQYYVNAVCSPTRASLMTGRSIIHHGVYQPFGFGGTSEGLNLSYTLMPQHLKASYGYRNYMVGKHLGMKTQQYQPTARGFDKYYGFYDGASDFFTHRSSMAGKDLHEGTSWARPEALTEDFNDTVGEYSTFLFRDKAVEWIDTHARLRRCDPMFLYVAFQAIHSANHVYLQAPPEYLDRFGDIDPGNAPCGNFQPVSQCTARSQRRSVAAMVAAMDDAVGSILGALDRNGMRDNTIVVFSTDNGGAVATNGNMASNFPLRGGKQGVFEGGIRGVGVVAGPGIAPRVSGELFHVSDWMPSLLTAVKRAVTGNASAQHVVATAAREVPFRMGDGVDNWDAVARAQAARTEIIHALQPPGAMGYTFHALRMGKYKLVYNADPINKGLSWNYSNFTVKCGQPPATPTLCPQATPCLFDLEADPCEYNNLAKALPAKLAEMQARMNEYRATAVMPFMGFGKNDPRANPGNWDDELHPWMQDWEDTLFYPTNYSGVGYTLPLV